MLFCSSMINKKRSNANDYGGNKPSKNREVQNSKPKQPKTILNAKSNNEESPQVESQTKRETGSTDTANNVNENTQNEERPSSSNKAPSGALQKV